MLVSARRTNWMSVVALVTAACSFIGCSRGGGVPTTAASMQTSIDTTTIVIAKRVDAGGNPISTPTINPRVKRHRTWIRWFNATDTDLKFSFGPSNPFNLSEASEIDVPKHCHTGCFLASDGKMGQGLVTYPYRAIPGGPPLYGPVSDPAISVDD